MKAAIATESLPLFASHRERAEREVRIYCLEHADRIRVLAFDHGEIFLCCLSDLPERERAWHINYFVGRCVKPALVGEP